MTVWLLILVLNHPILVKPPLYNEFVYPNQFLNESSCLDKMKVEIKKKSIVFGYCQAVKV